MKNKITFIIALLAMSINILMAQSPGTINYQGVARDTLGNPIANQQIRLRFKINDATANGPTEFTEVRKVTTSAAGLFNCQIGGTGAISQSASLLTLPWNSGPKFLKVEMDPTGGVSYTNMGTQQLASVPYALHARTAETFLLPYNGVDATVGNTFAITNTDSDAASHAIKGEANGGIGVFGNSNNVQGVYGSTNSASYAGVFGYNYNAAGTGVQGRSYQGTGVYGEAFGLGIGVRGSAGGSTSGIGVKGTAAGTTSYGVLGENTNGTGVKGIATTATSVGVLGENTSGVGVKGKATGAVGIGVVGESTLWYGIKGTTNSNATNNAGVYGEANGWYGSGVMGNTGSGNGVYGYSTYGTGLKGETYSGLGLEVIGNVKISGGNTSPGAGKVLTSDASGNATWQTPAAIPKVAFKAASSASTFPEGQFTNVDWTNEMYDISNNFDNTTNKFTVPVAGIYNFTAACEISINSAVNNFSFTGITIIVNRNGSTFSIGYGKGPIFVKPTYCASSLLITTDAQLLAGDQVFVQVYQQQSSSTITATISGNYDEYQYFTGHLVTTN